MVGGHIEQLPFMIDHYRDLGVERFSINLQLNHADDSAREAVREITKACGCDVASTTIGDWQTIQQQVWTAAMQETPNEWCVLADQDELQIYQDGLPAVLSFCDRHGYDYVTGAVVDRVSQDGSLSVLSSGTPLWSQFPLGGFISYPMMGADIRKVVAAKGHVGISIGRHIAFSGSRCPTQECFVQVHHFRWTAGLVERLRRRANHFRNSNVPHWIESARCVKYFDEHNGRIDIADKRFLLAPCEPAHPHWQMFRALAEAITERSNSHPR